MALFTASLQLDGYSNAMSVSARREFSGENQITMQPVIADGITNQEILLAIDVSLLKFIMIKSDKTVTIKTNNSGTPDDTLAIAANNPYVWGEGDYAACLITTDVEKIFVTNATADDANLQILAIVNLP